MPRDRADGDGVEHFLVDGVAPAVIGGGPPESPFEVEPDPEPGRHHAGGPAPRGPAAPPGAMANSGPPYGQRPDPRVAQPGHFPPAGHEPETYRTEPPTSPIPVINPQQPVREQEKRKSWVAKMFRSPGS